MSTLRLGLAGLGHGDTLLQANDPEHELPIRVTAICDTNEGLLEATSRKHRIDAVTTDFDDLAARDDLDMSLASTLLAPCMQSRYSPRLRTAST